MIKSFRHKGLKQLFETGASAKVNKHFHAKVLRQLDMLDSSQRPAGMGVPGWGFHPLRGKPKRYSVHVTGNWRLTFEWDGVDAVRVNLEDYH